MILYKPTIFFEPFFAIFAIAFIISFVLWKEDKKNVKLLFRTIALGTISFFFTVISFAYTFTPLYHYYTKDYNIVEGYVENFIPKTPGGPNGMESFSINGIEFRYNESSPGYNKTFYNGYNGGVIKHNGQHLRIGYLGEPDDENKYIIVIEAAVP